MDQSQYDEDKNEQSVIQIIESATVTVCETKDYISYLAVLDLQFENPEKYTEDESNQILETLSQVLHENHALTYEIGWDIPALVLRFLEATEFNFSKPLREFATLRNVLNVFDALVKHGNAKELFLRAVELLETLTADPEAKPSARRHFAVRFYALHELMRSSLHNVHVKYPSKFLATGLYALNNVFSQNVAHLDTFQVAFMLRRVYTFLRDLEMPGVSDADLETNVLETEVATMVRLLQVYLVEIVTNALSKTSVGWPISYAQELRSYSTDRGNLARHQVRSKAITADQLNLLDVLDKLATLALSFDIDLHSHFQLLCSSQHDPQKSIADEPVSSSDVTHLILYTCLDYTEQSNTTPLSNILQLSVRFHQGDLSPAAQEALLYWGLYSARNVTRKEVQQIPASLMCEYLRILMSMSGTTSSAALRSISFVISEKLLYLHTGDMAYDYLIDTLRHCPLENIREAALYLLKRFISTPKQQFGMTNGQHGTGDDRIRDLESRLDALALTPKVTLTESRIKDIQECIDLSVDRVATDGLDCLEFPILLSWLNFLVIKKLGNDFNSKIVDKVKSLDTKDTSSQRLELINLAVQRIAADKL